MEKQTKKQALKQQKVIRNELKDVFFVSGLGCFESTFILKSYAQKLSHTKHSQDAWSMHYNSHLNK